MESLIKEVYKELGIARTIAETYAARAKAIKEAVDEERISQWTLLARWAMGVKTNVCDEVLDEVEEIFQNEDEGFSRDNEVELQALVEVLLYHRCYVYDDWAVAMTILCGDNLGYKLQSRKIFQKIETIINDARIGSRKVDKEARGFDTGGNILKKIEKVSAEKKAAEENGEEFVCSGEVLDSIISWSKSIVNSLDETFSIFYDIICCQREETDILWWMVNGWSDFYNKLYSKLSASEAAIAAPLEVFKKTNLKPGPYAYRQLLYKAVSTATKSTKKLSLAQVMETVNDRVIKEAACYPVVEERFQPIMYAIKLKGKYNGNANMDAWKNEFENSVGKGADDFQMSPSEYACQLYLELELAKCE